MSEQRTTKKTYISLSMQTPLFPHYTIQVGQIHTITHQTQIC